ncbi:Calcineurin A [Komagataella phaffii GS115]|uniref:Serine/threonine-protein phosphatase n=2 Tax=Komagataella phaffii TaxID=460519 RepID=C4R4H7_KOMPG|nr:Calcineurin A [Komagataella phaffii GS115]AOA69021.1 GQ68_03453T0 [Komagataella phaffii GS115]CAY70463.1 Calcineurin A [Komagataella phaffii GS115]
MNIMLGKKLAQKRLANENTAKLDNALKVLKNKDEEGLVKRDYSIHITKDGQSLKTTERQVSSVPPPIATKPSDSELFLENGLPDHEFLRTHFIGQGRLHEYQAIRIIEMATSQFIKEPNLLEVPAPVTVCGDIHGQYYDLMKLFEVSGHPKDTSFLFLGDYVDRGCFSIECLIYLYSLKLNYSDTFWMLRGNHECRHLTEYFTFKAECLHKYSEDLYEVCVRSFQGLPLAAIMNKQFFCVHGGISPHLKSIDDVNRIDRFREPPTKGLMCDLLWADPIEEYDEDDATEDHFVPNTLRGCSYAFSYEASSAFLKKTGLLSIVRAHEAQDAGFRMYKRTKTMGFPSLLTMFSAPNYLDSYNNKAAVLKYQDNVMNIRQFSSSPHPYYLPKFMDVFTWSLPFAGDKMVDMLVSILNVCSQKELDEETPLAKVPASALENVDKLIKQKKANASKTTQESQIDPMDLEAKKVVLRNKILAIGRVSRMYQVLRQESENVQKLKSLSVDGQLPPGSLLNGPEGIRQKIHSFDEARKMDLKNEALPPLPTDFAYQQKLEDERIRRDIEQQVKQDRKFNTLAQRLSDF